MNIKYILSAHQRDDDNFNEIDFENIFFLYKSYIKYTFNVIKKKRDSRENVIIVNEKDSRHEKKIRNEKRNRDLFITHIKCIFN